MSHQHKKRISQLSCQVALHIHHMQSLDLYYHLALWVPFLPRMCSPIDLISAKNGQNKSTKF